MNFKKWILKFKEEPSPFGDVAREISIDSNFPNSNSYQVIFEYLDHHMPDVGIEAFKEAWKLYSSSK